MLKKALFMTLLLAVAVVPVMSANTALAQSGAPDNDYWWPNRLNLEPLRQHAPGSNPNAGFDYAEAFESLDLEEVKDDLIRLMTTSQSWWPADYGHYGPFFIRMAWHSAGTYRTFDGRGGSDGGMQRFAPLNSWPDNANLDKATRLLWPLKRKYGRSISWADLMILAGTVAMESMGFQTYGFAGGRHDGWVPEDVNWGPEGQWLGDERHSGQRLLSHPFGATQMGLIYVNPEGPNGNPDPLAAARDIRVAFGRMAMNDEETVALIAGGHTFGKAHGAANPGNHVGAEPEGAGLVEQGLGWSNSYGSGHGADTITSGLEGAWTVNPAAWTHNFLENLYGFEWEQTRSPAGAIQWIPEGGQASNLVPDAHDPSVRHAPIMLTTDLALKEDPAYRRITTRWLENPEEFELAFAKAWFKLTHRDLGPRSRYLGDLVPDEELIWQDPIPEVDYQPVNARDITRLKRDILGSGLTVPQLVRTAWASASSFRGTDMRGGANGGRLRLSPQRNWAANDPTELARVLNVLEGIQTSFNESQRRRQVSMADLIVLGGAAAIEQAAAEAGHDVQVPFRPGRADALQSQTDVASFSVLEPTADGFRNYFAAGNSRSPAQMLVERAYMLNLTAPEMTVLVGGLRALDANTGGEPHGVFTDRPGVLSNDFFVNLLDMSVRWQPSTAAAHIYRGSDRRTGAMKWTATPVDLIFGSNSELRAIAEFYATDDADEKFVNDFVAAWSKVMTLDRFDLE